MWGQEGWRRVLRRNWQAPPPELSSSVKGPLPLGWCVSGGAASPTNQEGRPKVRGGPMEDADSLVSPGKAFPSPAQSLLAAASVFRAPRPGCPCASCPLQVPCRCSPLSALQGLAPGSARSHLGVLTTQMNTKPGSGATKRGAGHSASPGLSRLPPRPAPPADRALVPLSSTAAASPRGSEMLPLALQAAPWLPPTARPRGFCAPPPPRGAPSRGVPRLHLSAGPAASARLLALCAPRAASLPRTPPGPAP